MLGLAFASKGVDKPFYEVSSAVVGILDHFNCDWELKAKSEMEGEFIHPGRAAEIIVGGEVVGVVGEIHPVTLDKIGLDERTAIVEINLNKLIEQVVEKNSYKKLSVYPAVERDIAFLVDKNVFSAEIIDRIKNLDELIKGVELFDVYEGDKVDDKKKSMAYHIIYRSDEKTLESKAVDKVHSKLVELLEKDFGAEVRK